MKNIVSDLLHQTSAGGSQGTGAERRTAGTEQHIAIVNQQLVCDDSKIVIALDGTAPHGIRAVCELNLLVRSVDNAVESRWRIEISKV